MISRADLSLSVFTRGDYKNLNYGNSAFRNSMCGKIRVNKSHFKRCDFSEDIFKNVSTVLDSKIINCNFNKNIFENVNFFKTFTSKSNLTATSLDENHFSTLTTGHSISKDSNIHNVRFDNITLRGVVSENVTMDLCHLENMKIKDRIFKHVTTNNSPTPEKLLKELHKQDATFENM